MKLIELVQRYCPLLLEIYKGKDGKEDFQSFLEFIIRADPEESKMTIFYGNSVPLKIQHKFPEQVGIFGRNGTKQKDILDNVPDYIDPEEQVSYALEFIRWEEWLGMEIDHSCFEKMPEEEILAECLEEMTRFGLKWKEVEGQLNVLKDRLSSCHDSTGRSVSDIFDKIRKQINR